MKPQTAILLLLLSVVITCVSVQIPSNEYMDQDNSINGEETIVNKVNKTDEEWKKILTPEEYKVLRKAGTERPFSGEYDLHFESGTYHCAACGAALFSSATKYNSGCGWPAFTAAVDNGSVKFFKDFSLGMQRVEVRCAACDSHLGHVFKDGPPPLHTRFCINSIALDFKTKGTGEEMKTSSKTATFAAGCFWGVEHKFRQIEGVLSTRVGYTGGDVENPSYRLVCSGKTGHAESVEITFDPSVVSYKDLLEAFFKLHDPTQIDRQGPDVGTQYRSVVFYHSPEQKQAAKKYIQELENSKRFRRPIATKVAPAEEFFKAEDYHQQYYEKRKIR